MLKRLGLLLIICTLAGNVLAGTADNDYTLYLVRHAEKQADSSRDPALTETGKERSQKLANWFRDKTITDIWSSDYVRTRDTAGPSASQLGLQLNIYDPANQSVLVRQLSERRHNALIVGHSNTIPELARLLCNCSIADMEESEYERMIVITISKGETRVETLMQSRLMP